MSSLILLEFTYNFGGLMQRRRNSMVNTLSRVSCALIHIIAICYLVNMKLFCVPNIAVHALPFRLASMPAVRFDLNGGLLTCLYFIIYQEYNVICISINRM